MCSVVLLAAVKIGGVFPLLCTPYTETGALDEATLEKEAAFVADCGANGIIWPAADDALKLLTHEEERRGWAAIAGALKERDVWFCPCCPGTNVTDQLRRLRDAEAAWQTVNAGRPPSAPLTALVRMVDDANDDAAYQSQYEQVAAAFRHPVIIQTYNGHSPMPSMKLMVDLAKRHPETYGWFKVEGSDKVISEKMSELVAAQPTVKTVFTGWGGRDWLYQYRQIGTRGVISQRPMYADLMVKIWRALEAGDPRADELFAKFMYLRNLDDVLPSDHMRGWNLYVLKRRGVFPNTLSREPQKGGGWKLEDLKLTDGMKAEIDARLECALGDMNAAPSPRQKESSAISDAERIPRLRVGLFVDRGCTGNGLARWAEIIDGSPDAELKILDGAAIRAGGLKGLDLLVMPGGRGDWQYASLGEEGAQAIRDYVADGGRYFGTCCGIALALNEDNLDAFKRLRMLPFKRVPAPNRGGFTATVAFNKKGAAYLGIPAGRRRIRYHNGPILQPAEPVPACTDVEVLATMECELAQDGPVKGRMYGTPAAVRATYGKGEMLAFNCHPEIFADSHDIVVAGICALTGRTLRLPQTRDPKGRERVGFQTKDLGAKKGGVEKYLMFMKDPSVYVVPLTADEVREGYGAALDRIVKPEDVK